jgi:hypothetical protein
LARCCEAISHSVHSRLPLVLLNDRLLAIGEQVLPALRVVRSALAGRVVLHFHLRGPYACVFGLTAGQRERSKQDQD